MHSPIAYTLGKAVKNDERVKNNDDGKSNHSVQSKNKISLKTQLQGLYFIFYL